MARALRRSSAGLDRSIPRYGDMQPRTDSRRQSVQMLVEDIRSSDKTAVL